MFSPGSAVRRWICEFVAAAGYAWMNSWTINRGNLKGWFPKGWFWRMSPRNENRNEGTFAKTTLLETAPLSPNDPFWWEPKRVVSKRVVSADVPPERKPERGYVRQNHPFTKPPFYLPVNQVPFTLAAVCNMKRGDGTALEHVGHYVQPRFVGWDCRNIGPATTQNLVVKFDGEICGGVLVENASDDFPQQKKLEISFQTSPEVRHQFRRKLRQLHSGNRWCLEILPFWPVYDVDISELSSVTPYGRITTRLRVTWPTFHGWQGKISTTLRPE